MREAYRLMVKDIEYIRTNSIIEIRRLVKEYGKNFGTNLGTKRTVYAERMIFDRFGNLEKLILLEDPWEELKHGSFGRAN